MSHRSAIADFQILSNGCEMWDVGSEMWESHIAHPTSRMELFWIYQQTLCAMLFALCPLPQASFCSNDFIGRIDESHFLDLSSL